MVSTKKWWAPLWLFEARAGSGCRADAYDHSTYLPLTQTAHPLPLSLLLIEALSKPRGAESVL